MAAVKKSTAFIVIEGGDGAGKSGVISALESALRNVGFDPLITREPGGTSEGEELRALLLRSEGPSWERDAELLLMNAARIQHVKHVIIPALQAGRVVISDRFVGSTIAYQGAGHGVDCDKILALHRDYLANLWPDLTIVLDVAPEIGIQRSRGRLTEAEIDEGKFESLELSFHDRVRRSFLEQARADPHRHIVIDAHQPADIVQEQAVAQLRQHLPHFEAR